jgi:acyl CoA:acetate/3-ketoacid CoA transferase beta subunit
MAQRAAREVHNNDRVYLDAGFAENVRPFLPRNGYTLSDGSCPVDIAFISATKISSGGNYLESPLLNGRKQREWSPIPIRGTRQTVVLIPYSAGETQWLVARCEKEQDSERKAGLRIITSVAVVDITDTGLIVREVASGVSAWEVQKTTDVTLTAGPGLGRIEIE